MRPGILPTPAPPVYAVEPQEVAKWRGLSEGPRIDDGPRARETRHHIGTVSDLLATACVAYMQGRQWDGGDTWAGGSFRTALHLAVNGWHDGLALVEDVYARVTATKTDTILPCLEYTEEPGEGEVDVALALEGEDACWLAATQGKIALPVAGRFVRLVFDPFASFYIEVDDVLRRGVYVAALAVLLERGGYRTQIDLRMPSAGSGQTWLLECSLKRYEDDLDLPRAMFWLAHPAALRHFIISAYQLHRTDAIGKRDTIVPEDCVHAPGISSSSDLDGWLKRTLQASGLTIEGE